MKIEVPGDMEARLVGLARRRSTTPAVLVRFWIGEKLDEAGATADEPAAVAFATCLVPGCPLRQLNRGLCPRHYQKYRYCERAGRLDEGWCVRHGRLLPRSGKSVEDYALAAETLETLPGRPLNDREDSRWFFGWPEAQAERARLSGEVV